MAFAEKVGFAAHGADRHALIADLDVVGAISRTRLTRRAAPVTGFTMVIVAVIAHDLIPRVLAPLRGQR